MTEFDKLMAGCEMYRGKNTHKHLVAKSLELLTMVVPKAASIILRVANPGGSSREAAERILRDFTRRQLLHEGHEPDVALGTDSYDDLFRSNKHVPLWQLLARVGNYTRVAHTTGCHTDELARPILENKMCFPLGDVDKTMKSLSSFLNSDMTPPGAVLYPEYKVCEYSAAVRDVCVHDLINEWHMGARPSPVGQGSRNRGVWALHPDGPKFYPRGFAITDWEPKENQETSSTVAA